MISFGGGGGGCKGEAAVGVEKNAVKFGEEFVVGDEVIVRIEKEVVEIEEIV